MNDKSLATLEALADARIGEVPPELAAETADELLAAGLVETSRSGLSLREAARAQAVERIVAYTRSIPVEWVGREHTQGEVLDAFASHCRDELDDVEVVEAGDVRLSLAYRRERALVELRAGLVGIERLVSEIPALLIGSITEAVTRRFVSDPRLRSHLAIYDLVQLEKIGAAPSSLFVFFEWFLRESFGVKMLPAPAFTRGLVQQGIISLGMG